MRNYNTDTLDQTRDRIYAQIPLAKASVENFIVETNRERSVLGILNIFGGKERNIGTI